MSSGSSRLFINPDLGWRARMAHIVETMREMSVQTDPQQMVQAYAARMREFMRVDRTVSLSRRGLEPPRVRVTRDTKRTEVIDPWKEREKLPVVDGGLLSELIYGDEPRMINDVQVAGDDPGAAYFEGAGSLVAVPHYDKGEALNMVLHMRAERDGYDPETFPELVWLSNLFGRATHNLVLMRELREAYNELDRELAVVSEIQRSLLPTELPRIPGVDLAASYQTSRRAGGDYYDLFELPGEEWGLLIADVSGHGTPAAVVMSILHTIVHSYPGPAMPPDDVLTFVNRKLTGAAGGVGIGGARPAAYATSGTFVTAFYGVYNPARRELRYSSAGHNPPLVRRAGSEGEVRVEQLDKARRLPLGVEAGEQYDEAVVRLPPGDEVVFYTDGITEARNPTGGLFGEKRLEEVVKEEATSAEERVEQILKDVERYAEGRAADDDRTLMVMRVGAE